ncbi:MAG: alpha/beta hydrolase, partial [Chloroflexota bacterium]
QATEPTLPINGTESHYYAAGSPELPPVVLLHGGGIDSAIVAWRYLIDPLARTHRVYAPNFPGYGESPLPANRPRYTTEYLIDTVSAFIDRLKLQQTALVGLSMGGATALGYTLANRERVTRLILVDSYGLQDRAPFHLLSWLALRAPRIATGPMWATFRRVGLARRAGLTAIYFNPLALGADTLRDAEGSVSLGVFYEWLGSEISPAGCKTNYTPQLAGLHTPTLLIHGRFDRSVPVRWARRAARELPAGQLEVIYRAGHWVNRERPRRFNRAVLDFLNSTQANL